MQQQHDFSVEPVYLSGSHSIAIQSPRCVAHSRKVNYTQMVGDASLLLQNEDGIEVEVVEIWPRNRDDTDGG